MGTDLEAETKKLVLGRDQLVSPACNVDKIYATERSHWHPNTYSS
jgi:hypothetical protein